MEDGLQAILDKIYYKDLQYVTSEDGSHGYYVIVLVTGEALRIDLGGSGLAIVFNPGSSGDTFIPVTLNYNWPVLGLIKNFSMQGFSYGPEAIQQLLGQSIQPSDSDRIQSAVQSFEGGTDYSNYTSFVDKINGHYTLTGLDIVPYPDNGDSLSMTEDIRSAIEANSNITDTVEELINAIYIHSTDADTFNRNLDQFAQNINGESIEAYLKKTLIPQIDASLELSLGLSFPRNILTPLDAPGGNPLPDTEFSILVFDAGTLLFSTQNGIGFKEEMTLNLNHPSQIGNTGIGIAFTGAKLDLSRTKNIPEADADGRPVDFIGVYIEDVDITLPAKWFKDVDNTHADIYGKNLLIGTGGLSGTIGLQALGGDNMLWATIGDSDGFKLGFHSFDIEFKQNKVLSSNISAAMEIKKFVYPADSPNAGQPVRIGIEGHIHDNGDFNLTATTAPPYPIELPDVFTYHISSLELGKEGDDFYIGTSGSIEFMGFLRDTLKLGSIDIDRLRIYSDGTIEFSGGTINLIEPIVLGLGPVEITVTAIHYGSHQKEVNGVMRKFNYFGFDGGISVDPLGIEVRGDGVNFYYCSDNLPDKPGAYLHIKTLYLDLTIPASTPAVVINGWLSIPEPGTSKEYAGGIKLQLPQVKIAGSADMKLMPRYPAFIIDVSIDLPAPIAIGPVGIYGFRGLIGYRYVAEKEAAGLVSGVDSWYDYYKAPPRGIHVQKFNGPDKTKAAGTPFSLGVGASLGTSFDNGTIVNIRAMLLLSIPSLFMIDGRAAILSARLGLDASGEPPFFAFIALGDNSLELGIGADFNMPSSSGNILKLYADIQAGFFFNDSSKWYVNVGTKTNPVTARVLTLITIKSFLMLSAKGIEAGARGEFDFNRSYGPIKVHAWAYIEVGGKISFERPQFGAFMAAGVGADIDIKIISLYASFDVLFGVEAPKPFLLYGEFRLCVKIKIAWVFSFKFCGNLSISWEFDKNVDRTPVNPLINPSNAASIPEIVKGVSMLSNETFGLAYLGSGIPSGLTTAILDTILPLDTYIDIKTEKGFLPTAVGALIGGVSNPPERYMELVPPDKIINGKEVRQVKHQYSMESIAVKSWNPTTSSWQDYHPYRALYPSDPTLATLKIGQFQKSDNQYNTIRLLATTPFSYTEQGQPGWFIPEQNGITPATLFCETDQLTVECANFLEKPLGTQYYCYDINQLFYSNQVAFFLSNKLEGDFAVVTDETNVFSFAQSLQFKNRNKLQIRLPEPSVEVILRLTTFSSGVNIRYFASLIDDTTLVVQYGNPDTGVGDPTQPYIATYTAADLANAITYNQPGWLPITRIEIEPIFPDQAQVQSLQEQIAAIEVNNNLIALGLQPGDPQSTEALENELQELISQGCTNVEGEPCNTDDAACNLYDILLNIKNNCLVDPTQYVQDHVPSYQNCFEQAVAAINVYNQQAQSQFVQEQKAYIMIFMSTPTQGNYYKAYAAINALLTYLLEIGNCDCVPEIIKKCYTLLHSVCWLSLEHYQYNINIPGQAAIEADAQATIAGITQYIQPIWRPDTHYAVSFVLKDTVDDGAGSGTYSYAYGFTTGGPLGFFHKNPEATYGDILLANGNTLEDANGIIRDPSGNIIPPDPLNPITPHPELYSLTNLTRYIDYNRSYPNADGNLLSSKPLFYDDETTKIDLFFAKAYATHFFHHWQAYNGQSDVNGRIKIVIKDPREGDTIVNPPHQDYDPADTQYTNIPQTIEAWEDDPNPIVPHVFDAYANLLDANECIPFGGDAILPPSQYLDVKLKHLKPLKLYTAIVNNLYDLNKNGVLEPDNDSPLINQSLDETVEVHRFTFQTSRYASFAEQVNSYLLTDPDATVTKAAIFAVDKAFTSAELTAAYDTILGNVNALSDAIEVNYQHKFDRIVEGVLGFPPLEKAISTEFNVIRNTSDSNTIVAVIIRNPEPFNNPRIPLDEIADTIQVLDTTGSEDTSYKKLFSKDYSQVIIMKTGLEITGPISVKFTYKIWNGNAYIVPGLPDYSSNAIGTIVVSNLDLTIS